MNRNDQCHEKGYVLPELIIGVLLTGFMMIIVLNWYSFSHERFTHWHIKIDKKIQTLFHLKTLERHITDKTAYFDSDSIQLYLGELQDSIRYSFPTSMKSIDSSYVDLILYAYGSDSVFSISMDELYTWIKKSKQSFINRIYLKHIQIKCYYGLNSDSMRFFFPDQSTPLHPFKLSEHILFK